MKTIWLTPEQAAERKREGRVLCSTDDGKVIVAIRLHVG